MTPDDFGPTGIDPDWYDNGPGSENWKLKMQREEMQHDEELFRHRARDQKIVRAAEEHAAEVEKLKEHPYRPGTAVSITLSTLLRTVRAKGET